MRNIQQVFATLALAFTALTAQAHDSNWSVGVVIGNPYPPAARYYAPPPVYYAPPPVAIYPHPHSTYYGAPNVIYQPAMPGFIQYSYGNGYRNYYERGPRGHQRGWGRGHGHDHHH